MAATLVSRRYQLRVAEIYGLTGTVADSPYLRHGMRSSSSVAGAGARSAGHPGLIGITLAVILLGLASDKLDSMLSATLNTLFGEWTSDLDLQWSLFVDHHLLAWGQWTPIIVFGLAAMLIFPCSLRDVFLLPNPTSWSWKKSAMVSIVVSVLLRACIFAGAWNMLARRAELRAGETVLVHAGLSGVGSAAVQIARALGAQVIATAGSAKKCAKVKALGAHHVIDYQATDFVREVRKISGKDGVQVVFEHVGEATFAGSLKCLSRGGRVVTCGATTGGNVQVSLHQVFFKSLSILGSTMGSKGDLRQILRMFEQGQFQAVLDRALPMAEVAEAHRLLESREAMGKIVLTV